MKKPREFFSQGFLLPRDEEMGRDNLQQEIDSSRLRNVFVTSQFDTVLRFSVTYSSKR